MKRSPVYPRYNWLPQGSAIVDLDIQPGAISIQADRWKHLWDPADNGTFGTFLMSNENHTHNYIDASLMFSFNTQQNPAVVVSPSNSCLISPSAARLRPGTTWFFTWSNVLKNPVETSEPWHTGIMFSTQRFTSNLSQVGSTIWRLSNDDTTLYQNVFNGGSSVSVFGLATPLPPMNLDRNTSNNQPIVNSRTLGISISPGGQRMDIVSREGLYSFRNSSDNLKPEYRQWMTTRDLTTGALTGWLFHDWATQTVASKAFQVVKDPTTPNYDFPCMLGGRHIANTDARTGPALYIHGAAYYNFYINDWELWRVYMMMSQYFPTNHRNW